MNKLMVFGFVFLFLTAVNVSSAQAWWDSSWLYRVPVDVTSATNVTDYQVYISINTSKLIDESKLRSDCADLRATDGDDNVIDFFLDDDIGCSLTGNSSIWFNNSITTNNDTQIYLYYGNSVEDTILSNGTNTLPIYDNFTESDGYTDGEVQPDTFEYDIAFSGYPYINTTLGYIYFYSVGSAPYHAVMRYIKEHPSDNFKARTKFLFVDTHETGTSSFIDFVIHSGNDSIYYDDYYPGEIFRVDSYPAYSNRYRFYNYTGAPRGTTLATTLLNSSTDASIQTQGMHTMYEFEREGNNWKTTLYENWGFTDPAYMTYKNNIDRQGNWLAFNNRYRIVQIYTLKAWKQRSDITYSLGSEETSAGFGLTITSPDNISYTGTTVTISSTATADANITYSIDGGSELTACNNCNESTNTSTTLSEGKHNVTVYAVTVDGNADTDNDTIIFTMDNTPPDTTFVSPTLNNETFIGSNRQTVNITLSETGDVCILDWNGTNQTMSGSGTNFYATNGYLGNEEVYTFKVYCNDSLGNSNISATRWLSVKHLFQITNTTISMPYSPDYPHETVTFAVCDLNGDGEDDWLVTQYNYNNGTDPIMYAFYGNGTQFYNFTEDVYRFSGVICNDTDGDGVNEVYLGYKYDGYDTNKIIIFEWNGTERSRTEIGGSGLIHGMTLANMSGMPDGELEIGAFTCAGYVLDYSKDISLLNSYSIGISSTDGTPTIGKMWNNVNDTCVCEYYGICKCYTYPSTLYWTYDLEDTGGGCSNNQILDVVGSDYDYLVASQLNAKTVVLNTTSKSVVWQTLDHTVSYYGNGFLLTEDLTGDGHEEVYIANPARSYVAIYDENGTLLWEDNTRLVGSMGWGDFDGDGIKEGISFTTKQDTNPYYYNITYIGDTEAPHYDNSTANQNQTTGGWTLLSLQWSDDYDLDDFIFSIRNGTNCDAWNIECLSYDDKNVSSYGTDNPSGIFWKSDGTKVYESVVLGDNIQEYDCTEAWNISSCSFSVNLTITGSGDIGDIFFASDGLKFYVTDIGSNDIEQLNCTDAWNISSCVTSGITLSTQGTVPFGLTFKSDGLRLYESDYGTDEIYQYSCTDAWNLSSCSYDSVKISAESSTTRGITFKPDGLRFYEIGEHPGGDRIFQYSCTDSWNLSSCTYDSIYKNVLDNTPTGIYFKSDGTKVYISDSSLDILYEMELTTESYVNQSWTDFGATTTGWSNGTFYVTDTVGQEVCWQVYANDTTNNMNVSEAYCFDITSGARRRLMIIS